jgi:hypothetical protein
MPTSGWHYWRHRLAHWIGWNQLDVLYVDDDGWCVRCCAGCGFRYRPAPPIWPL